VIGAPMQDSPLADAGAAYAFHHDANGWSQTQKLVSPDPWAGDQFGGAAAIRGDVLAVGAPGDDAVYPFIDYNEYANDAGSAFLFRRVNGAWAARHQMRARFVDGDFNGSAQNPNASDRLGSAVALSNAVAVVGAPNDVDSGLVGSVRFFD